VQTVVNVFLIFNFNIQIGKFDNFTQDNHWLGEKLVFLTCMCFYTFLSFLYQVKVANGWPPEDMQESFCELPAATNDSAT
jgi:hypothetical protein